MKVPLPVGKTKAIEIHDFEDETTVPDAVEVQPNTTPQVLWNAVADAVRYRVYHRKAGEATERLIYDKAVLEGITRYVIDCPIHLEGTGGVWHLFRVEAVDEYGNESVRQYWAYFAMALPKEPAGLQVVAGSVSGSYSIEIIEG